MAEAGAVQTPLVKARKLTPYMFLFCTCMYTSLCATADSPWLSKQLKNGSSWPRTSEAANGGKHAYPESGLQIVENPLEGGASWD